MKRVYLYPKNDISLQLSNKEDFKNRYTLIDFIDSFKKECLKIDNISKEDFDYIIICSPNYYKDIYKDIINSKISSKKIRFYVDSFNKTIKHIDLIEYLKYDRLKDFRFIKRLKNKHKGERAFLIGNGPSLKIEDLDLLKDEISFGANKIYLAYEKTKFRPTYYMVEDDLVYTQNKEEIEKLQGSIKLFPLYSLHWGNEIKNAYYFNLNYFPNRNDFPQFNADALNDGMYWGSTIVYSMIQWAVYTGCKKLYIIGLDFNFQEPKSYEINKNNRKDLICEGEVNHFHKDYRKIGEKWNLPNLETQIKSFSKAKEYALKHNIEIFNASRTSKLEVFEKVDFEELFK